MSALLASILAFFAFGGFGFWLLLLFLSIVYTASVECDRHGFAIFATIVAIVVGWTNVTWLFHNWQLFLIGIAAYVIAGGAWSVFRWFRFCKKFIELHPASKCVDNTKWGDTHGRERVKMTDAEFKEATEDYYKDGLKPSEHKSQLISWIVYWPWSLLWNFVGDIVTGMYEALANVYTKTAQSVIRKAMGRA